VSLFVVGRLVVSGGSSILPDPRKGNPQLFEQRDYFHRVFYRPGKKFFQEEWLEPLLIQMSESA
jgi:hypothetical protein